MASSHHRLSVVRRLALVFVTLALLLTGALAAPYRAAATTTIITQWTFNSPTPDSNTATGTTDPAIGVGAASLIGGVTATFQNIRFSFDLRHSNTAANTVALLYSTDGGVTFNEATTFVATAGDAWFNNRSFDFSSIPALNDNPNVVFRVVAAFAASSSAYAPSNPGSAYGTSGTLRFDMVTVRGEPIGAPTPTPSP
ncbi:MAG: endonuclease, partial [Roseiflexus sp.]